MFHRFDKSSRKTPPFFFFKLIIFLYNRSHFVIIKPMQGSLYHSTYQLCPWIFWNEFDFLPDDDRGPHEEMEVTATDALKCHIDPLGLKNPMHCLRIIASGRVTPLPPRCLSCLCPCHPLIQLSCNNNKSGVYRLFRVEGKGPSFYWVLLRLADSILRETKRKINCNPHK